MELVHDRKLEAVDVAQMAQKDSGSAAPEAVSLKAVESWAWAVATDLPDLGADFIRIIPPERCCIFCSALLKILEVQVKLSQAATISQV